jgi:Domain of unknown function (DUF4411)
MIHAWDNYPVRQFPPLWEWMTTQLGDEKIVMPIVAFEETSHKTPDCADWLKRNNIKRLGITNAVIEEAMLISSCCGNVL